MMNGSRQAILVIATLLTCCAGYTSGIRADATASPDAAYLYGRFRIRAEKTLGMDGYQTMGLKIQCTDKASYTVRFSIENRVQAIAIRPSRCALAEVVYTDADGLLLGRRLPPRAWVHVEDYAAAHAYYLGDFFAIGTVSSEYRVVYSKLHYTWDMDPDDDSFEGTTAGLKKKFVSLASWPTEDRRLVPRRPPPPPGAQGPPISIGEAARIAPYTKRSYRSPAECEAACSMGRCIPYRGENGVAVACIVRCKVDKDCPERLACNCGNPAGHECHAIAQIPGDSLEGICLSPDAASGAR